VAGIPLSPAYKAADALELELAFGEDNELTYGDALILAQEENEDEHGGTSEASIENDKREGQLRDTFRHIGYRAQEFGSSYPFTVETCHASNRLIRSRDADNDKLLYRFLLACSHFKYYDPAQGNILAGVFEDVCVPVAESYLNGEAVRFRAAGRKGNKRFSAKLKDALPELANYIHATTIPDNIVKIKNKNTGDSGIDIAVRAPFPGKDYFGMLTALGQCTCSDSGWKRKVIEAHHDFVSKYLSCNHPTVNLFFVPFYWRNINGKWDNELELYQSIPFDRLRICRLLRGDVKKELTDKMEECLKVKPKLINYAA
jgi:hypothetical protein